MQSLIQIKLISRLVLVWFALSIGVVTATPVVMPGVMDLICTSSGVTKLVGKSGDGGLVAHSLECHMCGTVGAPPPLGQVLPALVQPFTDVQTNISQPHVIVQAAVPPPARGPPARTS